MVAVYPAVYRDAQGSEQTSIENDGTHLKMVVRGVVFIGRDWDELEPVAPEAHDLSGFTLYAGALWGCVIECELPLPLVVHGQPTEAVLHARMIFDAPVEHSQSYSQSVQLTLNTGTAVYEAYDTYGYFDQPLATIQKQLPAGMWIKTCLHCGLSQYFPAGYGSFGWLACFRNQKAAARTAVEKPEILALFERGMQEYVQEIYLCPEFERR